MSVLRADGSLPQGADKRQAVEAMFDRVAPRYDRMNRLISLGRDAAWRRRALVALGVGSGARVLDLACGTGDLSRELAAVGAQPIGLDASAGMLATARALDESKAERSVRSLVRGDASQLPFRTGGFDGLVCGFALRNFVEVAAVLAECSRVVRPGGRLALLDAAVPTNPLVRTGHAAWFRGAVPLLGRLCSGDPEAYRYLPRSTAYLPPAAELLRMLASAGFAEPTRTTMMAGSVQLLTGTRR